MHRELVAGRFATREQAERGLAAMHDPALTSLLPMLISAWGRKAPTAERQ